MTRHSLEMRRDIAEAEVGDAVLGDDPTVARLEDHAAELLGGLLTPELLADAIRPGSPYQPTTSLLCLENTHNGAGEVMERAWRIRRRLGGGMRQAGLLAAAGVYALQHNLERLADDHRRAARLAALAAAAPGAHAPRPETNIVMIDLDEAIEPTTVLERLRARGVWMTQFGRRRLRAITHLDVDDEGVERAGAAFAEAVADASG